ncbi:uncharacterized protein LOC142499935 [Ascaphus truei]|uniref:uncharacterized protein LOC142499935 n=1 Tax=Ascaphus truei TaxID=8439 RepID=UPI003F5A564B
MTRSPDLLHAPRCQAVWGFEQQIRILVQDSVLSYLCIPSLLPDAASSVTARTNEDQRTSKATRHANNFLCYFKTGSKDYCSPANDVTTKGEPCPKDHPCGWHDETYNWCYMAKNMFHWNWDYCGRIISDCDKPIYLPHRRKRQAQGQEEEICRINDSGNRRITVLTAVGEPRLTRPSREQFMEASRVINMINANTCFGCASGTIFSTNAIRIDLQGTFVRNGVRYINIQLQINGPRHGQSSIAQVISRQDLDIKNYYRYIRRALQISMRGAYHGDPVKVTITIERYSH